MDPMDGSTSKDLVEQFLDRRLPKNLADQIHWPALAPDARGVICRLLALMRRSSFPATEFNTQMIWLLASVTPAMLPSAWGGRVPPLTSPGRHRKLDELDRLTGVSKNFRVWGFGAVRFCAIMKAAELNLLRAIPSMLLPIL